MASVFAAYNPGVGLIYLDNNSTTRVCDAAIVAMTPYWREQHGNPSSLHLAGQTARAAVETARAQVAGLIGARPREIVFTGGGTEADNLAILGTLAAYPTRRHIVTTTVEHVAVHSLCGRLAKEGYRVTFVGVDSLGRLDLAALESAIGPETALVSVMHANNETGVLFPIGQVAAIARARGVVLHVDAVQSVGKLPVDVAALGADLVSLSAHKIHGPKGTGALYVRPGTRLRSQQVGGHQERDLRPGTENVPAIVGFGAAAEAAGRDLASAAARMAALRDTLESAILSACPGANVNGDRSNRVCNTTNIAFPGLEAEAILIALSQAGVCASAGSACSSGALEPSHVLAAMGVPADAAKGSVRFSLSRETTREEIDAAIGIVCTVIHRLRGLSSK